MLLFRVLKDLLGGRNTPDEGDVLRLARELLERSSGEQAIELLTTLLRYKPDCVEGLILRGAAKREIGRVAEALADLTRADQLVPDDPRCLQELAIVSYLRGDKLLALEYCLRARRITPDLPACCKVQAQIALGDEYYYSVLERILHYVKPRTYFEIGVFRGETLCLAKPPTLAIGIDPEPQMISPPAANAKVFAETSDAFFANHDLRAEFGGLPVELAFIDGMHHFDFALRDFANLERYCDRGSTILVHDCYPLDRETAERDRHGIFWSGDIWRLIVLLKKYRPDLSIHTIGVAPTGLGLVQHLDPRSGFLFEHYDRLRDEFMALDYSYLDEDKAQKLNFFPNDWGKIRSLLGFRTDGESS